MKSVEGLRTGWKREEDALKLVVPYLDPHTLTLCLRVCKAWQHIFVSALWSNPLGVVAKLTRPFCKPLFL